MGRIVKLKGLQGLLPVFPLWHRKLHQPGRSVAHKPANLFQRAKGVTELRQHRVDAVGQILQRIQQGAV